MKPYPIQLEISGPIALWARPDTMPSPVCLVAPIFSVAKDIFQSVLGWKSANVRPRRCDVCASVQFHRYDFNYPDSESGFRDGTTPCATEGHAIPAFLETVYHQAANISAN